MVLFDGGIIIDRYSYSNDMFVLILSIWLFVAVVVDDDDDNGSLLIWFERKFLFFNCLSSFFYSIKKWDITNIVVIVIISTIV